MVLHHVITRTNLGELAMNESNESEKHIGYHHNRIYNNYY